MPLNIYDLAREANVSIATASKALNGRRDVNEQTRKRVLEVAKRINYHPSHLARGLASRRTENIGIVSWKRFPDASLFINPFYSRVLEGMESEVTARNYNLLLSVVQDSDPATAQAPKMVRERGIDGLIMLGEMPPGVLSSVFERRLPTVIVDAYRPELEAHYVLTDNRSGVASLVRHFAELGHKRLAFLVALPDWSFQERRAGFHDACMSHGIEAVHWDVKQPFGEPFDQELARLLKDPRRPTGIIACNDGLALHAWTVAKKLGLDAPRDFSLAGFDDIERAEFMGLTTVRVDKQTMGARAIQRVFKLMEPPLEMSSREDILAELVVRKTTGPVKS